jgi:hypothetical protein
MGRTCVSARWLKRKSAGAWCFVWMLELRETAWLTSTASPAAPLPGCLRLDIVVDGLGLPSVRIPGLRYRCPALFSFWDESVEAGNSAARAGPLSIELGASGSRSWTLHRFDSAHLRCFVLPLVDRRAVCPPSAHAPRLVEALVRRPRGRPPLASKRNLPSNRKVSDPRSRGAMPPSGSGLVSYSDLPRPVQVAGRVTGPSRGDQPAIRLRSPRPSSDAAKARPTKLDR